MQCLPPTLAWESLSLPMMSLTTSRQHPATCTCMYMSLINLFVYVYGSMCIACWSAYPYVYTDSVLDTCKIYMRSLFVAAHTNTRDQSVGKPLIMTVIAFLFALYIYTAHCVSCLYPAHLAASVAQLVSPA